MRYNITNITIKHEEIVRKVKFGAAVGFFKPDFLLFRAKISHGKSPNWK